jgi:hypothetical protein
MTVRHAGAWLRRYGPAELLAVLGALAGFVLGDAVWGTVAAGAVCAAIGDNVAYYGLLLVREARARGVLPAARALVVEFGPAEVLDGAFVRPACMALAVAALGPVMGVVVGKLAADLVFYVPVIVTYEATRRQRGGPDRNTIVVSVSAAPTRLRSVRRKASSSAVSRQATRNW